MSKHLYIATALLVAGHAAFAFPIAVPGTEGVSVIVTSTDPVLATYQGNSASYNNDLLLNGNFIFNNQSTPVGSSLVLGSFAVGTELIFELRVNSIGFSVFTGLASRNPDGQTHARVQTGWQPNTTLVSFEDLYNGPFDYNDLSFSFTNTVGAPTPVPEPGGSLLMLAGLAAFAGARARFKHRP